MTNAFFAPTAPDAPRYTFAWRAIESSLIALAAAAAFGGTWFVKYTVMLEFSFMSSGSGHGSPLQAFFHSLPYALFMCGFLALVLVIVYAVAWLGVGAVTFALASIPALQRRPRVLRALGWVIVGLSGIAGSFAMPSGFGLGGAFIG